MYSPLSYHIFWADVQLAGSQTILTFPFSFYKILNSTIKGKSRCWRVWYGEGHPGLRLQTELYHRQCVRTEVLQAADPSPTGGVVLVFFFIRSPAAITLQLRSSTIFLRPSTGIEMWVQWEASHHGRDQWYHTPPWPLPAVRDLTRNRRLSTYDESVPKLSKVSFRGKCPRKVQPPVPRRLFIPALQ